MAFQLPKLPYAPGDFAGSFSAETFEFHYGKHHKTYIDNMTKLIEGTAQATQSLEQIMAESKAGLFNNSAQAWNHTFYWLGMSPKATQPDAKLLAAINKTFGSLDGLKESLAKEATTLFGSGWAWLVSNDHGDLSLKQTSNADLPIRDGLRPILTCDVWEHAYYIDYRNARAKYVETFWKHINWEFVSKNYANPKLADMTQFMK